MAEAAPKQITPAQPTSPSRLALRSGRRHLVLLGLVLALGCFARTWEYGRLPPSLNPDEASTGVEAQNLVRYGQDRNGIAYPVKFISWGSGQDVLYAYLLMPLVAVGGLSPLVVRLPMLIAALAMLPLTYLATREVFGAGVALMATFMLAISPWHVMLSRWALDSNFFPFVFLAGFTCLLMVRRNGWWFIPACILFALCLYAYGTAYMVIPTFMAATVGLFAREKSLRRGQFWCGLATLALLALPIGLLLVVNRFGWDSIRLGPLTVPRFPVDVRWELTTVLGASDLMGAVFSNSVTALRMMATESDGISYNAIEPYGVFYRCGLALALAGFVVLVVRREWRIGTRLLMLWLGSAALVALVSTVNINRLNIAFVPLIILGAFALHQLQGLHPALGPLAVLGLLAAFSAFTVSYHGSEYRVVADFKFQNGVIPALRAAEAGAKGPICVTDEINMPYIYALFAEPMSPDEFQATVEYVDPTEPLRRVASFGRFVFGTARCQGLQDATYVLRGQDTPPRLGNRYQYGFYDNFVVYTPLR